jgi:hypothetical protein
MSIHGLCIAQHSTLKAYASCHSLAAGVGVHVWRSPWGAGDGGWGGSLPQTSRGGDVAECGTDSLRCILHMLHSLMSPALFPVLLLVAGGRSGPLRMG